MSAVIQDSGVYAEAGPRAAGFDKGASLRVRLAVLVGVAVLFLLGVQGWNLYQARDLEVRAFRAQLSSIAQGAAGILDYYRQQQEKGVLSQQAAQDAAKAALQGFTFDGDDGQRAYLFITDMQGVTLMNGGSPRLVGTNAIVQSGDKRSPAEVMAKRLEAMRAGGGQTFLTIDFVKPGGTELTPKMNIYKSFEPWGWVVGTGMYMDGVGAIMTERTISVVVLTVVAAAILLAVSYVVARGVLRQIGAEPSAVIEMMRRAAQGDLTQQAGGAEPGSVVDGFDHMTAAMRKLIAEVRDEAAVMKRDAQRIAESVSQVSTAAVQQSDATSSMAAAVEELTVSVAHISDAANQTQRNSEGVAEKCRDGETQVLSAADGMKRIASAVAEASDKIRGLEERAVQINSIAASIKEIAGQTNLLALNAAIEAARAGEQGRGFSVVADEVRKLAERTSSATVEIEEMVSAVQQETAESTTTMQRVLPMVAEGTSLADQVAVSLREISSSANTSLERVREVAHATKEQSAASTSIAQQVESIAQMVEETTAAMNATARSADEMRDMADRLDRLVGNFRV